MQKVQKLKVNNDEIFLRHLNNATEGLTKDPTNQVNSYKRNILKLKRENAKLIVDFINDCINRKNISLRTRANKITSSIVLMKFLIKKHKKEISFKDVTKEDFFDFRNSLQKPTSLDPFHKWIGAYNTYLRNLKNFYRYVNDPNTEPKLRKLPNFLIGINQLPRKEVTIYSKEEMWTEEDDLIFLKYCEDPRIRCYHMMARDTSGRPHELLAKKIGEMKEKVGLNGEQFLETNIGAGGKTKQRPVSLYSAFPYYIDLLNVHPTPTNSHAYIFVSSERGAKYKNIPLSSSALSATYLKLRKIFFPRLLKRENVPENDKKAIKNLLKKPWNPYIRRHTGLSDKATKINEINLTQHAGWVLGSKMLKVYVHINDTSNDAIKNMWGIKTEGDNLESKLKPQICKAEGCGQANKPDATYCIKCKRILSFEGYNKVIEENKKEQEKRAEDITSMRDELKSMREMMAQLARNNTSFPMTDEDGTTRNTVVNDMITFDTSQLSEDEVKEFLNLPRDDRIQQFKSGKYPKVKAKHEYRFMPHPTDPQLVEWALKKFGHEDAIKWFKSSLNYHTKRYNHYKIINDKKGMEVYSDAIKKSKRLIKMLENIPSQKIKVKVKSARK